LSSWPIESNLTVLWKKINMANEGAAGGLVIGKKGGKKKSPGNPPKISERHGNEKARKVDEGKEKGMKKSIGVREGEKGGPLRSGIDLSYHRYYPPEINRRDKQEKDKSMKVRRILLSTNGRL